MFELMIHLDGDSEKPLYGQIYSYIRSQIVGGKISCGEKLPSTRFLSRHLQVSRSTVELAYDQLLSEGYIESVPCRGYYAGDVTGLYLGGPPKREDAWREEKKATAEAQGVICFSADENDYAHFPYAVWRKLTRELLAEEQPKLLCAGDAAGEWDLREAICAYLYHARGVNCGPHQIVVGAGNEYLLMLLSHILGERKRVAMENPTYLKAYGTLFQMGHEMLLTGWDGGGISMEEIDRLNPDVVYAMPSHQFPMGTVMPMKRRLQLLQWASMASGRYIIEDDHDSEFRYRGKPIPSLQGSDAHGTVIYIGTFSKSVSPAVRVSYMALPERLLANYRKNCGFYSSTVPREQQALLTMFLRRGYFERHLNKMRRVYKAKHDIFLSLLKDEPWVKRIYGDYAGMHLLVEAHGETDALRIAEDAKKEGVRVYALEEYMVFGTAKKGGAGPTLLLGYGGLSESEMREGLSRLRRVFVEE